MIIYIISNFKGVNTGKGGHYYSLFQMVQKIKERKKVLVFTIGEESPQIFKNIDYAVHISGSVLNIFEITKKIESYIKENELETVSIFHGYDELSCYSILALSKKFGSKYLITKCGGITKSNYPEVDNLIVFHTKDYDYYKSKKSFKKVYLIPNRVKRVERNSLRLEHLNEIYNENFFNIVKIGRIGKYYKHTLQQSINLAALLSKKKNVKLIFIGYLESIHYKTELEDYARLKNVNLAFFVDEKFTKNASELLFGADLVVGTGRGAMEAASLGKTIFFPVKNRELPCLLDETTAKFALDDNFSERTVIPHEYYFTEKWVHNFLNDNEKIKKNNENNSFLFQEWFCIEKGVEKILDVYKEIGQCEKTNTRFLYFKYLCLGLKLVVKRNLRVTYAYFTKK